MIYSNLHTHTTYSDGKDSPRAYIEAAIKKGFRSIGFSDHGYVWFDNGSGMSTQNMLRYTHDINRLKAEYAKTIDVFHGLENDLSQLHSPKSYDYTIGAVHYVRVGEEHYVVDDTVEKLEHALAAAFGGEGIALAQAYFQEIARLAQLRSADICAHMDVVKRFNQGGKYFDEANPAYQSAALEALEQLVENDMILEVSTAAIYKGVSEDPYPAKFLLRRAQELGARVIINSDAHTVQNLNYGFAEMEELLISLGFKETWELTKKGFVPMPLSAKKGGLGRLFKGK